jgi:hypothetical protein
MLYRQIIVVYCYNCSEHTNTVKTSDSTYCYHWTLKAKNIKCWKKIFCRCLKEPTETNPKIVVKPETFRLWYNSIEVQTKRNSEIQSNSRAVHNCLLVCYWRYKFNARFSFKRVWKPPHTSTSVCIIHKDYFGIKHRHGRPSASI